MSRAGLNRLTPHATAILLLAANVPDIDVASAAWGSLAYLNYHRHLTHALVVAPLMAILPLLIVRLFAPKAMRWWQAYLMSLAGVLSHLALDLTNVYGVRPLLPFSARWFRLDITHVIDPWILGALILAVSATALSGLIGSEIGEKRRPGRVAATLALAFLLLYDGARAVLHQRALSILDSRVYSRSSPKRVAAFPREFNPFAWRGVVESGSSYLRFNVDVEGNFDPTDYHEVLYPQDGESIRSARETQVFRDFLAFSQFPAWTVTPVTEPPNGFRVEATDLRFNGGFKATAILDGQRRVVRAWFEFL